MAKGAVTALGTGGMATKIAAASIATDSGADMVILNGEKVSILNHLMQGDDVGTIFLAHKVKNFDMKTYIIEKQYLD